MKSHNVYLRELARGYRASASFHDRMARMAHADGDEQEEVEDRRKASEYRRLARQIEVQLEAAP
jgi:hypothetical protein